MFILKLILLWFMAASLCFSAEPNVLESRYANADFELTADPGAPHWNNVAGVLVTRNYFGEPIPGRPTEIRSRWTAKNLYLLYTCPYEELNLKPDPDTVAETQQLWNWDVAEAFIGTDFEQIGKYKEFEISPRGEWIDLDINRVEQKASLGAAWNSGFKARARIDSQTRTWYGEMAIPLSALGVDQPRASLEMRLGLYRIAGAAPARRFYAWQPTGQTSFHVPKAFGRLRLVD